MSIKEVEFNKMCLSFIEKSNLIGDNWTVEDHSGHLLLRKDEIVQNFMATEIWVYVYCVSYSISYEVPEFYFSIHKQNGSPVLFDEFWPYMSTKFRDITDKSNFDVGSIVSEFEHPLLFRPFYKLHPCRTKDLMELHNHHLGDKYLICWMSTISSLMSLDFSIKYSQFD